MERKTILSLCRQYRYCLWREWDMMNPSYVMFVGLNPSTADEVQDDPTIRRCVEYSKQWGYGALCMANLFAYRTTKPTEMKLHSSPIGIDNDGYLLELARDASLIVAAWGVNGTHLKRDKAVIQLLAGRLSCLKTTKNGHPSHSLYLKKSLKPILFA